MIELAKNETSNVFARHWTLMYSKQLIRLKSWKNEVISFVFLRALAFAAEYY
jgi:hypothetical protein